MDHGALPPPRRPPAALTARARALIRLLGGLAIALALGFLGHRLWQLGPGLATLDHWPRWALVVGVAAPIYGLAGVLLAEAWRQLLGGGAGSRDYYIVYGRTQIAKYLPGNCFHFVGRQALGARLGHGQIALALASLGEVLVLIAVAAGLAVPAVARHLQLPWHGPALAAAILATVAILALIWRPVRQRLVGLTGRPGPPGAPIAWRLTRAGLCHLAFLSLAGALVWLMAATAATAAADRPPTPLVCISAFAAAWLSGVVVPGAAAGIGVRDALLTMLLSDTLGAEAALLVSLAMRLVTSLGDALLFALAIVLPPPSPRAASTWQINPAINTMVKQKQTIILDS